VKEALPHDNEKFFKGYQHRIDFIKLMTEQVKSQLSDDDSGKELSPDGTDTEDKTDINKQSLPEIEYKP